MDSHWRILNRSDLIIISLFEKNYSDYHVHTSLEGSNTIGMKWIKVKVVEMERNVGLKAICRAMEQDFTIHWMQGGRVMSGWGMDV